MNYDKLFKYGPILILITVVLIGSIISSLQYTPCDYYNKMYSTEIHGKLVYETGVDFGIKSAGFNKDKWYIWARSSCSDSFKLARVGDSVYKPANSELCTLFHGKEKYKFRYIIYEYCRECIEWKRKKGIKY